MPLCWLIELDRAIRRPGSTGRCPTALARLKTVSDTDDPTNEISAAWASQPTGQGQAQVRLGASTPQDKSSVLGPPYTHSRDARGAGFDSNGAVRAGTPSNLRRLQNLAARVVRGGRRRRRTGSGRRRPHHLPWPAGEGCLPGRPPGPGAAWSPSRDQPGEQVFAPGRPASAVSRTRQVQVEVRQQLGPPGPGLRPPLFGGSVARWPGPRPRRRCGRLERSASQAWAAGRCCCRAGWWA